MTKLDLGNFVKLEEAIRGEREDRNGNEYYTIDDLPLVPAQKEAVLEWLAHKYWNLMIRLDIQDGCCKGYDPLMIWGNVADSYVFDLEDGGRHHSFNDYQHLEKMLFDEILREIQEVIEYERTMG